MFYINGITSHFLLYSSVSVSSVCIPAIYNMVAAYKFDMNLETLSLYMRLKNVSLFL